MIRIKPLDLHAIENFNLSPFVLIIGDNHAKCLANLAQQMKIDSFHAVILSSLTIENIEYLYRQQCNNNNFSINKRICLVIYNYEELSDIVLQLLSHAKYYNIFVVLVKLNIGIHILPDDVKDKLDYVFIGKLQDKTDKKLIHHQYVNDIILEFDVFEEIHKNLTKNNTYLVVKDNNIYWAK